MRRLTSRLRRTAFPGRRVRIICDGLERPYYQLSRDPSELNDLATEFPEKVKELSAAFFT